MSGLASLTLSTVLSTDSVVVLDGVSYTTAQLREAMTACRILSETYAVADDKNGGGSKGIAWECLDEAAASADIALGPAKMKEINALAKRENGVSDA